MEIDGETMLFHDLEQPRFKICEDFSSGVRRVIIFSIYCNLSRITVEFPFSMHEGMGQRSALCGFDCEKMYAVRLLLK